MKIPAQNATIIFIKHPKQNLALKQIRQPLSGRKALNPNELTATTPQRNTNVTLASTDCFQVNHKDTNIRRIHTTNSARLTQCSGSNFYKFLSALAT